jgi:protoheme IX farnesyltransferase
MIGDIPLHRPKSLGTRFMDFRDLTKPRLNAVVVITTLVGYCVVARDSVEWVHLMFTLTGTGLAAAGASVFNQVIERRFDALMQRTADRPLPAGRISPFEACIFGLLLGVAGIGLLAFAVNTVTALLGTITLGTYLFIYTPAKRWTTLCTLLGAIPGALPVAMGATAATGNITAIAIVLFLILFMWQIPHFLAIAILYRDDYERGGFSILPVGDKNLDATSRQVVLYCLALIPVTIFPGMLGTSGRLYVIIAIILNAMFTWLGIALARNRDQKHARRLFFASLGYLLCLLPSMVIDHPY